MVNLTIDGRSLSVPEGTTVLEAAKQVGIHIPNLCYDPLLSTVGACRMCLVSIEGFRGLTTSCTTPVAENMVVLTETAEIAEARRVILDLLLANHPLDCLTCEKTGNCQLQDYCYRYGVKETSYIGEKRNLPKDTGNHLIERDFDKCILCGKCVRVCAEVQGTNAYDFVGRGFETIVDTAFNLELNLDNCRFCGQCVEMCPTGALTNKQFEGTRPWQVEKIRTTCPFCGTGCTFDLNVRDGKVVGVTTGNPDGIVNNRSLCVKGRFHTDLIYSSDRITTPLIKKEGRFVEASWDEALDLVASKFKEIQERDGGDALAALSSARATNEENFIMQKFMRAVIGTNNVDHCART